MLYREYSIGNTKDRKRIVASSDTGSIIQKARLNNQELYFSYYEYDEEIIEHMKIFKTVSGYRGKYYLNNLTLDLDNHDKKFDNNFYKSIVLEFCDQLMNDWDLEPEHIRISYSGRGYHIVIPDIFGFEPSNKLPLDVKQTIERNFNDIDTSPMSPTGLIRANYTLNEKVNRYKIPFTYEELKTFTAEEIIKFSEIGDKRTLPKLPLLTKTFPDAIIRFEQKKKISDVDGNNEHIISCIQKIFTNSNQDNRHPKMLRMVGAWKRQGITQDGIKVLLENWRNRQQVLDRPITDYEIDRMVKDAFKATWNFTCHDGIMAEHCDTRCIFYNRKNYNIEVNTNVSMEAEYKRFVKSGGLESAYDLKGFLGISESFKIYPGTLVTIWADTGIGKSAFAQSLMVYLSGKKILYLTLEVPRNLMFRRFVQIANKMTEDQINKHYMTSDISLAQKIGHITVLDIAPKLEEIANVVAKNQPNIVVIDTVGDIELSEKVYGDPMKPIIQGLRSILQRNPISIIAIHHISKEAAQKRKKNERLTLHSGKGDSILEQKSDMVISIEGNQKDSLRLIQSLKARDETPFDIKMEYEWQTFNFYPWVYS